MAKQPNNQKPPSEPIPKPTSSDILTPPGKALSSEPLIIPEQLSEMDKYYQIIKKDKNFPNKVYKAEYKELAKKAMMLGMSFEETAMALFNTTEEIFIQWMVEYPDFADSIKEGGEKADLMVADCLHQLATGIEYTEEAISPGVGVVQIQRYLPPNIKAIQYWLNNRRNKAWQNRINNNLSGEVKGGVAIVVIDKDDEEL